jgi:hypothetical protein
MRNTLFQTVATSLAVMTLGVSLATTPVLAGARHGGGGGGGSRHVAAVHRGSGAHVQYAGHGYGGGGGYYGGAATGALIGGAIANQNQGYYYPQNGGYYYPGQTYAGYSDPGYVYSDAAPAAYNNGDSVAYCEQTYRSYDPVSGSYLGYDGYRHACP